MNGNLVDTNVIVKLLNGNPQTDSLFDSLDEVYISVITVGGAYLRSAKIKP